MQKLPVDNDAYARGVEVGHWLMEVDPRLPERELSPPGPPMLFDLEEDPGEADDVASLHPEIVQDLAAEFDAWFAEVSREWRGKRERILDD